MNNCEGFPQIGCPDDALATCDMLGFQLCDKCADNWRHQPTREDEHAGATINALRLHLDEARQRIAALVMALDTIGSTIYTQGRGTKMEQSLLAFIRKTLGRDS